jgi:hypothetical protein
MMPGVSGGPRGILQPARKASVSQTKRLGTKPRKPVKGIIVPGPCAGNNEPASRISRRKGGPGWRKNIHAKKLRSSRP